MDTQIIICDDILVFRQVRKPAALRDVTLQHRMQSLHTATLWIRFKSICVIRMLQDEDLCFKPFASLLNENGTCVCVQAHAE